MSVYLIKEYGVLADEASNTWLEQMGRRFSARTGSPVKILILDNRMLNAFTLPGGRIFVCRGLLEQAGSAEEVAGVLAHEMAHDGRRHPLRQLIRTLGTVLVFQLAIGDGFEGLEVAEAVAEMGSLVLALKYSRDFEREADRDAIGMLQQEGISLRGLRDFFERVDGKELNADALKYLGTHPSGAERLAMVGEALAKQGPTTPLALVGVPWKVQPKIEPETIRPGTP